MVTAAASPLGVILALGLIGVFYAGSSWALISAVGDGNAVRVATENSASMRSDATRTYLGGVGEHVIQILFVTSLFACILSFHNIVARSVFALANRGALPASVGAAHPRFGSPHRASVAAATVVAVLIAVSVIAGLDPIAEMYTWLAGFASVGVVLLYALTSAAVVAFFARRPELRTSRWKTIVAPALGLLGLVVFFGFILQNLKTLVGGSTPLAIGVLVLLAGTLALGAVVAGRSGPRSP